MQTNGYKLTVQDVASHSLIHGDFHPARDTRLFRVTARLGGIALAILVLLAMLAYGVKVHFEGHINRLARDTREMSEENKSLQVQLNRLRSYKNVETAAAQVPHLRLPPIVLNVRMANVPRLPDMPPPHREFPRVYGY